MLPPTKAEISGVEGCHVTGLRTRPTARTWQTALPRGPTTLAGGTGEVKTSLELTGASCPCRSPRPLLTYHTRRLSELV